MIETEKEGLLSSLHYICTSKLGKIQTIFTQTGKKRSSFFLRKFRSKETKTIQYQ